MLPNQTRKPTSVFDKIGNSEPSEGGVYPAPGTYPCLWVDALKVIESRKGDVLFIAEFDILESQTPERPQGTRMSWVANLTRHEAAPGNVRAFLAKLLNATIEEIGPKESEEACAPENPCHGRLIRLEAVEVTTKAGNPFTRCNWSALPEEIQLRAAEYRQAAGYPAF